MSVLKTSEDPDRSAWIDEVLEQAGGFGPAPERRGYCVEVSKQALLPCISKHQYFLRSTWNYSSSCLKRFSRHAAVQQVHHCCCVETNTCDTFIFYFFFGRGCRPPWWWPVQQQWRRGARYCSLGCGVTCLHLCLFLCVGGAAVPWRPCLARCYFSKGLMIYSIGN